MARIGGARGHATGLSGVSGGSRGALGGFGGQRWSAKSRARHWLGPRRPPQLRVPVCVCVCLVRVSVVRGARRPAVGIARPMSGARRRRAHVMAAPVPWGPCAHRRLTASSSGAGEHSARPPAVSSVFAAAGRINRRRDAAGSHACAGPCRGRWEGPSHDLRMVRTKRRRYNRLKRRRRRRIDSTVFATNLPHPLAHARPTAWQHRRGQASQPA